MWKKIALITIAVVSVGVGTAYAESALPTVYHVYMDGTQIGTVEDKEKVQSYVKERIEEAEQQHEDWDLSLREDLIFKEQKVLSVKDEEPKVLNELKEEMTLNVDVVRLYIDGQAVAHLPNKEKVEKVIEKVKEQYVEPEMLEEQEGEGAEELPVGEPEVTEVRLSGTVTFENQKVSPSQVHTVKQAVSKIEEGDGYAPSSTKGEGVVASLKTPNEPLLDVLVTERERKEKTIEHKVEMKKTDELYEGETKVKQAGTDGKKELLVERSFRNGKEENEEILKEKIVKEPITKVILKGTKPSPSRGSGDFIWPAEGGTITSKQGERWGRYHKGIDIAGVSDKTIKASDNGKVVEAGLRKSFGNKVVIDHGNGYETVYAHMSSLSVQEGQVVRRGEKIGVMGSTGRSTGTHLHFEIHKNDSLENPLTHVSQ
jgi:murein DD-endopeptidase MepM/ murein hydrolase activator NlpD